MKLALKAGLLGLMVGTALTAGAQDSLSKKTRLNGGFGHFNFSLEQLNLDKMNSTLSANGFEKLNPLTFSYGGGGAFCVSNFVIGGGGAWLAGSRVRNTDRSLNIKGGYGYFSLGYILFSGRRYVLYPSLGIGGGGYSMIISKKDTLHGFSEQLNSPSGMVTADAGGWMTNVQLSYQYFFNNAGTQGFFIGIRAGYKYSPSGWKISVNDNELSGAPTMNMNGFYATIILGGGSLMSNN